MFLLAQVFLLVLVWLMAAFGHKSREERKRIIVSYDNMCHLNKLKAAKKPLPLPGDLQYSWLEVVCFGHGTQDLFESGQPCKSLFAGHSVHVL